MRIRSSSKRLSLTDSNKERSDSVSELRPRPPNIILLRGVIYFLWKCRVAIGQFPIDLNSRGRDRFQDLLQSQIRSFFASKYGTGAITASAGHDVDSLSIRAKRFRMLIQRGSTKYRS